MSDKKDLFTVVGTTVDPKGNLKMRWANDLVARIKNLSKAGHTDINLVELPEGMSKLAAAEYLLANCELTDEQKAVVEAKIAEKSKASKKDAKQAAVTGEAVTA